MIKKFLLLLFLITFPLYSVPPKKVPATLYNQFTENGIIPVSYYYYRNDSYPSSKPRIYTKKEINENLKRIARKECKYYGATDLYLYESLEKYISQIKGKQVAIIGSVTPWYESIIIYYGGHPTTIEYNTLRSLDPRLKTLTVSEYEKNPVKFDAIISISSIEHDGLGRYGDPINPTGDLEAMQKTKKMLKEGGLLFLAVPIGQDRLCWNVHRIYGKIRLPQLLEGWNIIDTFGYQPEDLDQFSLEGKHQPVFVLSLEQY